MTAAPWTGPAPGTRGLPPATARGGALPMTEANLLAAVKDLARLWGLLIYHTRDSRGSDPGFPDLVITGPRGVLFRELKSQAGKVTRQQSLWITGLAEAGANCGVWRPQDWQDGSIAGELRQLCARLNRGEES